MAQDAPEPIPIAEWSTDKVSRIGQAIYEHDRAAWVATDALMEQLANRPPPEGLVGWIVVPEGDDYRVRFVRKDGEVFSAIYDIVVRHGRAGAVEDAGDVQLDEPQSAMARARMTAASNLGRLVCSPTLNTVVLEDPDSDGWLVWLLTSTTDANIVPMGGHYRFTISSDGSTVQRRDILSNTCLALPKAPPAPAHDSQPLGLGVSQIVSRGPVETHVFLSLLNRMPIFVAAGDTIFLVEGSQIRKVEGLR